MVNNPFTATEETSKEISQRSRFDIGRVVEIKSHQRGDENPHRVKVAVGGMEVDEEGQIFPMVKGDVAIPSVGEFVLVSFEKGNKPLIIGHVNDYDNSDELKTYEMGDRRVGHTPTEADVFIKKNGDIKIESDNPSQESPDPPPSADVTHSHTTLKESQQNGRDREDYTTNWYEQKGDDQFFSPGDTGGTYGVGESFQGVVASQPGKGPNYTEFVELGFQPTKIEFSAVLSQGKFNEGYYSGTSSYGWSKEAHATSEGVCTLNPLSIPSYVKTDSAPAQTSQTTPRTEGEPYEDSLLKSPTQLCRSTASFGSTTEARSYSGDDQVIRIIQTMDPALTEEYRVELRVKEIHEKGFLLEWFMNNEPGATWNNQFQQIVNWTAYR